MNTPSSEPVLDIVKTKFAALVAENDLLDADVAVAVSVLTAEQAIGSPTRHDFPIVEGREQLIEAVVGNAKGHAFTDAPREFSGLLRDVLALPLTSNDNRAVFVAALNATMKSLGLLEATLHCRDDDPERCARELAGQVHKQRGGGTVGLIGLNPAIAEALAEAFGPQNVRITDLNRKNIGRSKFGVTIWDGKTRTEDLVRCCDVVVITGTTLVNGTFDAIWNWVREHGKDYLIYGVTAAGVCALLGLNRLCPYARAE